jgi:ABC-type Fe3+-hydroxamate transport system substrate-binding protein
LVGELTGAREHAETLVQKYRQDLAVARANLTVKGRKVVVVRIRTGNIILYSVWQSLKAVRNGRVFVNVGGVFLDVAKANLVHFIYNQNICLIGLTIEYSSYIL